MDKDEQKQATTLPFELNNEKFIKAWQDYCEFRKENRWNKLSARSTQAQWDHLSSFGSDIAVEAINISIRSGWRGIFPDRVRQEVDRKPAKKSSGSFASLGALQLQLKDLNERIRTIRNPSGQAWPPPLTGEKQAQCDELIRQRDAIQVRINQFAT